MSTKSFLPSKQRLTKARREGDVAKSRELTVAASSLGAILGCVLCRSGYLEFSQEIGKTFALVADFHTNTMLLCLNIWSKWLIFLVLPPLAGATLAGVLVEVWQAGLLFEFGLLAPKLERLNPLGGVKRILGIQASAGGTMLPLGAIALWIKACATLILIAIASWWCLSGRLAELVLIEFASVREVTELLVDLLLQVVVISFAYATFLGAVDLLYQRSSQLNRLKMTLEELKREFRENEGDPELQQQRKQLHREVLLHQTVQAVRRARVLVINKWS